MLSLQDAMIATIGCALVIFLTRLFPFALFSKRNPPKILQFVAKYLPPMVMAVLIFYCLRNISFTTSPDGLAEIVSIIFIVIAHLWKGNSMISIFGGTIIYMVLKAVL